jgi:hypothetical protein
LQNRKDEFKEFARKVFTNLNWVTYNRFRPEEFTDCIHEISGLMNQISHVVIDISGMSKMLIMVLLHGLRNIDKPLSIIYARAERYYPLREDFERDRTNEKASNSFPYYLTTHVYDVVTTTELSSIAMQGAPLVMIAFPNFNYLEVAALLNGISVHKLYLIESINDLKKNQWRLDAIRWINRGLATYINPIRQEVDASDIPASVRILENIYRNEYITHKIILSPTGGKLQAVASFCLKIMHPDIHIIYPVVKKFAKEYTEGYLDHSEIFFPNFQGYTHELSLYRKRWDIDSFK